MSCDNLCIIATTFTLIAMPNSNESDYIDVYSMWGGTANTDKLQLDTV